MKHTQVYWRVLAKGKEDHHAAVSFVISSVLSCTPQADLRTFHPNLKVDLGRGPGKGLGPRLFVGMASAAPLPLTASQANKLGVEGSFDEYLNLAQVFVRLSDISRTSFVVDAVSSGSIANDRLASARMNAG